MAIAPSQSTRDEEMTVREPVTAMRVLEEIIQCPRCNAQLESLFSANPRCANSQCAFAIEGFRTVGGQPILIDFEESIFSPSSRENSSMVPFMDGLPPAIGLRESTKNRLRRLFYGTNKVASEKSREFLDRLRSASTRPRVLVIGGGARGLGTEALYESDAIDLIGTDVYASPNTLVVVDGHRLPFRNESFDGVWIQAVLEHVIEPQMVAAEIHRVLRLGGLVYAETPFLQDVHAGAYDFTRFTLSGHRWLFRHFEQIDAGTVAGAGTKAQWSVRYLLRALGVRESLAVLLSLPLFWLRLLDQFTKRGPNADAASCLYFFGIKSKIAPLTPKDMVSYYEAQRI
jgi:SAM-dependent methyltransferase